MSSTEFNIGLNSAKTSSRVLKPPGGGHSDIFGSPELKANPPRPKYNQQNSSNMNGVMGTTDPNIKVVEQAQAHDHQAEAEAPNMASQAKPTPTAVSNESSSQDSGNRARVPPGGFSSGLW
ncbi:uncharacterized protein LOC109419435 [Aedes albopictus]|uniref:Microtubule-associated protein Jupiter n=1 Tax=Aedes albopictus TaxID=7160 RepID=A0A023EDH4_AEDAL|nr:uncharacterized protein LOC109403478 [Aedes albopictus]XP_019549229.1 uncharacterized protein LOC109419435 [Aedes albopictus]